MLQYIINGLQSGSWYSLLAVSIVIVMKASDVPNFAVANMGLVGAFLAYSFVSAHLPFGVAVVLGLLGAALFGVIIDRAVIQRLGDKGHFPLLLMTIGISLSLAAALELIWGTNSLSLNAPWSNKTVHLAGQIINWDGIVTIATGLVIAIAITWFFHTTAGVRMRAVAENRSAARLVGVRISRVSGLAWGIGTAVAALAMILQTESSVLSYTAGDALLVPAFVAATAAGFTSHVGAYVAGLVIGVLENLTGGYISTALQSVVALVVVVLILLLRPSGFTRTALARREV